MLVLELGQVVYIAIDDDPQRVSLVMRLDVAFCKRLRHDDCRYIREEVL